MTAHTRTVRTAIAVLLAAAGAASADPGSLVSFSWSVWGDTTAAASAGCDHDCKGGSTSDCSSDPAPSFAEGGATLSYLDIAPLARTDCTSKCNCCANGAGATGSAGADVTIWDPVSSVDVTTWRFHGALNSLAAAGAANDDCTSGTASAAGSAGQTWELVFDVDGDVARMTFALVHTIAVIDEGSFAESTVTLVGPDGTILSQTLSRAESGGDDGSTRFEIAVPAGRYTLRVETILDSSVVSDAGGSAGAVVDCDLSLQTYECPTITDHPEGATVCAGDQASFAVEATGSDLYYQWRRDGVDLADGPTGNGSTVFGATTSTMLITGLTAADSGDYDCVVSNLCGGVPSEAATLHVCIADFNCDGRTNVFDFLAFQTAFGEGDPAADVAPPFGVLNVFDFLAFQTAFSNGC